MPRVKGSQNHATIVRKYLHKKFKDVAENDLDKILESVVKKAVEDESLMAQKLILDNMDKITQWEQKNQEVVTGIKVIINRDGTTIETGNESLEIPNLGSHTVSAIHKNNDLRQAYKGFVGPIEKKPVQHEGNIATHFEPETLYQWKGEVMGLGDVCRMEGIGYHKVDHLMRKYDLSLEDAVQEVIELTDHPDNEKYHERHDT